jgi:hypothetical protein
MNYVALYGTVDSNGKADLVRQDKPGALGRRYLFRGAPYVII